uniref:Molybdopterin synthase sulfur carrier subunit n=1 Tax=Romanomermis culicivorax TaxID=13658 RepID=A0A915JUY3_ROMCU
MSQCSSISSKIKAPDTINDQNPQILTTKLLFFAAAKDLIVDHNNNKSCVDFLVKFSNDNRQINGYQLKQLILDAYPSLKLLKNSFLLAVNLEYIENMDENLNLFENVEIAIIPPVSGG